jgi:flagellar hook capping protein FlgD
MCDRLMKTDRRNWCPLVVALWLLWGGLSGRANVYATDIKLNGSTNNAAMVPAGAVQISYILNEPATNVLLRICSGASVVWSNSLAGTNAGSNGMVWGGTNQAGQNVAAGVYQISITAAAAGHAVWTNITDDSANFFVLDPSGIAVNKNTNSPYYGRVFVGDAPPSGAGVYKFNADGSAADEGGFSQSYPWSGGLFSPWKMAVAQDDKVYINDWIMGGRVMAFDEVLSTNYLTVLDSGNYPYPTEQLSGPFVTGGGTNTQVWMADANTNGLSVGVVRWNVTAAGTLAANDTGAVVVGISSNGLPLNAYDVSVDAGSNIYVIQCLDGFRYPGAFYDMPRLFCFPPYSGQADLTTNWSVGSLDYSLENAAGVAVDPTGQWVAVAVEGYGGQDVLELHNGAVNIYEAADGALVTRLGAGTNHAFIDVAWDQAGNLYATDLNASFWRAYSPPGANAATTTAVPIIQVYDSLTPPLLSAPAAPVAPANQFGFTLQGQGNVTYIIESSPDLVNWTPIATNYDTVPLRAITVPATGNTSFFQAVVP